MIRQTNILLFFIFIHLFVTAQEDRKIIEAIRTTKPPVIDGYINDDCWQGISVAGGFKSFEPYNDGRNAKQKTEVKVVYDDMAVYFAAMMYDTAPDSILKEFGERDFRDGNTDIIAISLQTFDDGLNALSFWLTAAGVQIDIKITGEDMDPSWDAVWKGEVQILENGWSAEFRIPYSALRFPKTKEQKWGLNIWRSIRRYREWSTWQFVDKKKGLTTPQVGLLTGIKNVKPPVRLSFSPYVSAYAKNISDNTTWGYTYNGGMDVKYGLNESFTLDMTLIPDFGQVQSDDIILNLSPFETYYNEKRTFFTEGTELFSKCDIFYSRRIGNTPAGYYDIYDYMQENETIVENPKETKLINATKFSGRTNGGLGIGIFNAMTSNTFAVIKDSLGQNRKISTQPFTNYNMLVFDQSLKNNSYISFANTNVLMNKNNYSANVTGTEFGILDKNNTYQIFGTGVISRKYTPSDNEYGYSYEAGLQKVSGNFTFDITRSVISDTYDPNDMGFLTYNNEIENQLELSYNIYSPFWKILNTSNSVSINHYSLYNPNKFAYYNLSLSSMTLFENYLTIFLSSELMPSEGNDFYESRNGSVFKFPAYKNFNIFFSPDYRKKFLIDLGLGYEYTDKLKNMQNQITYNFTIAPRLRVSDKMILNFRFNFNKSNAEYGYVNNTATSTYFGERQTRTITNTLSTAYIFNNKSSLKFRLRYYWSTADYIKFFELNEYGYLDNTDYSGVHDINFNTFTIDMTYKWQFAPGSEMSVVWKNSIFTTGNIVISNYYSNIQNTFQSPMTNSFSVKFLYYLDYLYLSKLIKN